MARDQLEEQVEWAIKVREVDAKTALWSDVFGRFDRNIHERTLLAFHPLLADTRCTRVESPRIERGFSLERYIDKRRGCCHHR
jgi:hypothetical protein